jgi:leucyl aminopeptidase
MAPPRVEEYLAELFCGTNVSMQVVSDQDTLLREYPLFACVNRAASVIPRHAGRIIFLTYEPAGCVLETIMVVSKGVTFDTGGVNAKDLIQMTGMSRDKCGAAASAGFMQVPYDIYPAKYAVTSHYISIYYTHTLYIYIYIYTHTHTRARARTYTSRTRVTIAIAGSFR